MRKLILVLSILLFVASISFGQTNLTLETSNDGNSTFIKPSLSNAFKLLFASQTEFDNSMLQNNYKKTATGRTNEYMASSTKRSDFRIITKDSRMLLMFFSPNNVGLISNFRNEIKKASPDLVVQYEDGYETYKLLVPYDGLKYRVTFRLKEETSTDVIMGRQITTDRGTLMALIN